MIREGLFALLRDNAGVAAIAAGRVFTIQAPDQAEVYPCVSYRYVGGGADPTLDTAGVIRQRIEVSAHSQNADEAAALLDALVIALIQWQPQTFPNGARLIDTNLINPGSDFEAGESRYFRCFCEFAVLYSLPN
jgi:hypothetical protein